MKPHLHKTLRQYRVQKPKSNFFAEPDRASWRGPLIAAT
jgi:hypothetical protein